MRGSAQVLVIGPSSLAGEVARALPRCKSLGVENLLGGVWTVGRRNFDAVVVALSLGTGVVPAIRSLRQVAPSARIVVTQPPAEEPRAREALAAGADDYVLEPVAREDLEAALQMNVPPSSNGQESAGPTIEELVEFGEVLRNLGEGATPTLERLAALVQKAFGAQGAVIRIDECQVAAGHAGTPVLQEPIRRQEAVVGSLGLGRRLRGSYTASSAARLGDYARLVETVLAQVREREHWQTLAWHDDLTGLHNRRYFEARLDQLIGGALDERQRVTVLLFDIDDFKSYNDSYWHDTGDARLREVAKLLTHCSRERDIVSRYGGDEFALILWDAEKPRVPGSQHPSDPMALADRFRKAITEHRFACLGPAAPGPVTISGGLACLPWDGKTRPELMKAADDALLEAKRTGKNRLALANGGAAEAARQESASGD